MIYLVQRGHVRDKVLANIGDISVMSSRVSELVDFDYMGSAEFEFGALPKSFRGFQAAQANWEVFEVPSITDENEQSLWVFTGLKDKQRELWLEDLQRLRYGKPGSEAYLRTKEYTDFRKGDTRSNVRPTNFWWDIENHAMFSFSNQFISHLPIFVTNSLKYMDEMAKAK
jgi:hypothetical protein